MKKISYRGYRFPQEIIQQAIWLYLRFTLSLRDVPATLSRRTRYLPKCIRSHCVADALWCSVTARPNRGVSLMCRESCNVLFGNVIKRNQALADVGIGRFESAAGNQTRRP
jgi:hypothetical protein